ncbi:hypothetical protein L3Q65_30880 [Amycolatopsis sp. FU40]|uniref:hypothetical protein n=1 Tax=Amycolatopsis sp. FU40 TaxID=2914159 RepID=UPI001F36C278|nr:hypothetical protein [Amycolatopsis sp. FU40]UKD52299.1 hypothetical protein L3Q65_30880 [Amycolatopsis sp. FU40]
MHVQCSPDRLALTATKPAQEPLEIAVRADNTVTIKQGQQHAGQLSNTGQRHGDTWQLRASSQTVTWQHNNKDITALSVTGTVQCGQAPPAAPTSSGY